MKPIHVVVPVILDPEDPSVQLSIKIEVQDFPAGNPLDTSISLVNGKGNLRPFEEIQHEYALKVIAFVGNPSQAGQRIGISRQTLTKWAQATK